jgi:dephospho-CoA kinase
MTQSIRVSNGDLLHFPDEMTDDQIHNAIQKEYGSPSSKQKDTKPENNDEQFNRLFENPGKNMVARDAAQGILTGTANLGQTLGQKMVQGASGLVKGLNPGMAPAIDKAMQDRPAFNANETFRPVGSENKGFLNNLAEGAGEVAGYSAPALAAGIPALPSAMIGSGIQGAENATPGQTNLGGALPSGRIGAAIKGAGEAYVGGKALSKVIEVAPPLVKSLMNGLSNIKNPLPIKQALADTSGLEAQANKASKEYNQSSLEHKMAQEQAQVQGLGTNPSALQSKANKNQEQLQGLYEEMGNQRPLTPKNIADSQENIDTALDHHEKATNILDTADENLDKHLNPEADHSYRASRTMKKDIDSINSYWSDQYKDFNKEIKKSNFHLLNSDNLNEYADNIAKAKTQYAGAPDSEFGQVIAKAPNAFDRNASDFINKYKDFRDARFDLIDRLKTEQSAVKRQELIKAYADTKPFADMINSALEEGLGEFAPKYKYLMNGYKTQVYPLRNNSVAQKIVEGKPLSSNISNELTGDQEGQELLREIAKRNPETLRNIVGQQYKKSNGVESITNPDERLREYTNQMPDLQKLTEQRNTASVVQNEAKSRLDEAQNSHKELIKSGENYTENREKIEKLHDNIATLDKSIADLRRTSSKKGLALGEKVKSESELKNAIQKRSEARRKLIISGFGLGAITGVPLAGRAIKNLF